MTESPVPHGTPAQDPHLARAFEAATCRSQRKLAAFLGIHKSSILNAEKRDSSLRRGCIMLTLLCLRWINPDWLLTGYLLHLPVMPSEQPPAQIYIPQRLKRIVRLLLSNPASSGINAYRTEALVKEL